MIRRMLLAGLAALAPAGGLALPVLGLVVGLGAIGAMGLTAAPAAAQVKVTPPATPPAAPQITPAADPNARQGCAVWYDGCNTCRQSARGAPVCTRRYCGDKRGTFRCLQRIAMPAGCQVYFDGCNTCRRAGGAVTCTVRTCARRGQAACRVSAAPPANCVRYYDGCNTCMRIAGGRWGCTKRACAKRGTPRCLETR